jgi:hypothetical protein
VLLLMPDIIVDALGKDIAGIIYRLVHQDLLSDVIREYNDLMAQINSHIGTRFNLSNGWIYVFTYRTPGVAAIGSNWKCWQLLKPGEVYPANLHFQIPSNYWFIKELY